MTWLLMGSPPPEDGSWILVTSIRTPYYRAAIHFDEGHWVDMHDTSHDAYVRRSSTHYMAATHWMLFPAPPEDLR